MGHDFADHRCSVCGDAESGYRAGDGWFFEKAKNKLTITTNEGTTAWRDKISDNSSVKEVEIRNGVTSIGNSAFSFCQGLRSITIPNSVTLIGEKAFYYCINITSITIPDSVTSIGERAFYSCNKLETIIYPQKLNVSNTDIPDSTVKLSYSYDENDNVTVMVESKGNQQTITISDTINNKPVIKIDNSKTDAVINHNHKYVNEKCTICGAVYPDHIHHKGGTATCIDKAICEICNVEYGDFAEHDYIEHKCSVCGAVEDGYLAGDKYKQTADKDGVHYIRYVFSVSKDSIKGKTVNFVATYNGTEKTIPATSYYTGVTSNNITYAPADSNDVLFVVTIKGISAEADNANQLTCNLEIK